mgnify:CR=1 FL=1
MPGRRVRGGFAGFGEVRAGYQGLARKCKKNVIAIERPSTACALQQEWIARWIFAVQLSQV